MAHEITAAPAALSPLPDEILEDIFVCLDDAADLARACASCTTFRRARRLRAPVSPPLSIPPHSTDPRVPRVRRAWSVPPRRAASPVRSDRTRFRASRRLHLLLPRHPKLLASLRRSRRPGPPLSPHQLYRHLRGSRGLRPLHRRYVQLPQIPDDLAATTGGWGIQEFEPFLDPAGKAAMEEGEDFSSFQVMCVVHCKYKLVTFHFSSGTGKWSCSEFNRSTPLTNSLDRFPGLFERHYVHGCFFWTLCVINSFMFMLDMHEMKICTVDLPPTHGALPSRAVVEAGEGRVGLLTIGDGMIELYTKPLRNNGEEWQRDKLMPLPDKDCRWHILGTAEGYLLVQGIPLQHVNSCQQMPESQIFTLDLKTFLFERLCGWNQHINVAHLYARFPPLLSVPRI